VATFLYRLGRLAFRRRGYVTLVRGLQLGMPGDEVKSTATTERRAYDDLAKGSGPGFNGR
jgi:hypothetical protein